MRTERNLWQFSLFYAPHVMVEKKTELSVATSHEVYNSSYIDKDLGTIVYPYTAYLGRRDGDSGDDGVVERFFAR